MSTPTFLRAAALASAGVMAAPAFAGLLPSATNPDSGGYGSRITIDTPAEGYAATDYVTFGDKLIGGSNSGQAKIEYSEDGRQTFVRIPVGAPSGRVVLHSGDSTKVLNSNFKIVNEVPSIDPSSLTSLYYYGDKVVVSGTGLTDGAKVTILPTQTAPECSDGIDNDKDGFVDYPADPQCTSASDNSEASLDPTPGPQPVYETLHLITAAPDLPGATRKGYFLVNRAWKSGQLTVETPAGVRTNSAFLQISPDTRTSISFDPASCVLPFGTVKVSGINLLALDGANVAFSGARQGQFKAIDNRNGTFQLLQPGVYGRAEFNKNVDGTNLYVASPTFTSSCPVVIDTLRADCANVGDTVSFTGQGLTPGLEVVLGNSQRVLATVTSPTSGSFTVPKDATTGLPIFYTPFQGSYRPTPSPNKGPNLTVPCSPR